MIKPAAIGKEEESGNDGAPRRFPKGSCWKEEAPGAEDLYSVPNSHTRTPLMRGSVGALATPGQPKIRACWEPFSRMGKWWWPGSGAVFPIQRSGKCAVGRDPLLQTTSGSEPSSQAQALKNRQLLLSHHAVRLSELPLGIAAAASHLPPPVPGRIGIPRLRGTWREGRGEGRRKTLHRFQKRPGRRPPHQQHLTQISIQASLNHTEFLRDAAFLYLHGLIP